MFNNCSIIIICGMVFYVLCALLLYNRQGDIENTTLGLDDNLYTNKDKIIDRLYQSVVYKNSMVRWPHLFTISMIYSLLLISVISGIKDDNYVSKFIIIMSMTFLILYGTFNFLISHGGAKEIAIASALYGINKKSNNN